MKNHKTTEHGSALIATVVICLLLMALTFCYFQWSWMTSKVSIRARVVQSAQGYAESGMEEAQQFLRQPGPAISTTPYVATEPMRNGRLEYSIVAPSGLGGVLEAYATGYYNTPQGNTQDPSSGQRCQIAVIRARLHADAIDKPMIAAPGTLRISRGTIASGLIYADNLVFANSPDSEPPAVIGQALYNNSIKRDDGTPDPYPSYVVFGSTPQQAGYPLVFPRLGSAIRDYYRKLATSSMSQLRDGTSLDGYVMAPPDNPVYFCDGDLHVGQSGPATAGGSLIVYVTGNLFVHDVLDMRGPFWIVFLVEKDVIVDPAAADNFKLTGTYIANGKITSGNSRHSGKLTVNGSLVAGDAIDLGSGWESGATYYHRRAYPTVPLPRLTQLVEYTILQGKYQ